MGAFSWCTSDTKKSIPCCMPFGDLPDTVYLLNPFGEPYKETDYEGYGVFGGRDVYELVVEWNREYLTPDNINKPERSSFVKGQSGDVYFANALEQYKTWCDIIQAYAAGASDAYIEELYGKDLPFRPADEWKRNLGIQIACYNVDHVKLKYPIKIVEHPMDYDKAGISPNCPFQGCIYPDSLAQIRREVRQAFARLAKCEENWRSKASLASKIQSAEARAEASIGPVPSLKEQGR